MYESETQCPKCLRHAPHIYSFESSKNGTQWVIERCPACNYSGWPDNPLKYSDYLKKRRSGDIEKPEGGEGSFWRPPV